MNRLRSLCLCGIGLAGIVIIYWMWAAPASRSAWHAKYDWTAEKFFDDPQVARLCRAIERNDLAAIERLVKDGANVNAIGKGAMTPLMWSFPGHELERFRLLLKLGADPNVIITSDLNTRGAAFRPGQSVTELAASTHFDGYFEAVMDHGGDVNLVNPVSREGLLICIIRAIVPDAVGRVELFAKRGGDIRQKSPDGCPAIVEAAMFFDQFDVVSRLLDLGADPVEFWDSQNKTLAHILVVKDTDRMSKETKTKYSKLTERLAAAGVSMDQAKADFDRWRSWDWPSGEGKTKRKQEVAERHARERAELRQEHK